MKLRFTQILLTAILFSFISCTKEMSLENKNGTAPVNGDFYGTINGNQWSADSLQDVEADTSGMSILGLSKTGDVISMFLPQFKTGTYTLNAQSASYAVYANIVTSPSSEYLSNFGKAGGTITITSIDTTHKLISGNFQLTLINPADNTTKTITGGILAYVPYEGGGAVVITPPPAGGGNVDTLTATVNGNSFNGAVVESEKDTISGQLLVAGISADGITDLALDMPMNIKAGTYNLDFNSGQYFGFYNPSPTVILVSMSNGTLTIISNDVVNRRIKGTFSFIGSASTTASTANVTQGYFSVSY
jgi:hypothetical protein